MKISVSQLKLYNKSPAERAGKHLLGLPTQTRGDESMLAGTLYENFIFRKMSNLGDNREAERQTYLASQFDDRGLESMLKVVEKIDNAIVNSEGLAFEMGQTQVYVEGMIAGYNFTGYVDNLTDTYIDDIKTTAMAKNPTTISQYSGLSHSDEYELQLRVYMYLLGRDKARIIEVITYGYTKKPKNPTYNIYEYTRNKTMDDKRLKFIKVKGGEMQAIYDKVVGK